MKYSCRDKDGKFLSTNWEVDYDPDNCGPKEKQTGITSMVPIMYEKKTVALVVNHDKCWGDKTVQETADLIVAALNSYNPATAG